jgi:alpha/beta superfamily hydrolase
MHEEKIFLNSGEIRLEGLLYLQSGDKGVVVSHPHPLYGGEMHNNVVEALCHIYQEKGYSTLRFNFRGVGLSEGSFDSGSGEQEDVDASLKYLYSLGKKDLDLAGYSFGSWVNALGLKGYKNINRVVMISPPVGLMDFSSLQEDSRIKLVISGSEDEIADIDIIKKVLPSWNKEAALKIIQGGDHFYWGKTDELKKLIAEYLE